MGSGLGCHGYRNFFGLCLLLRFGYQLFPVATLLQTSVNGADLSALFDYERRGTLRAGFRYGHVRSREITIRVARAAIENARAAAATLAGAATANELALFALRAFDAHGDRPRVLALRIAGTA